MNLQNRKAFRTMLAWSEGTLKHPLTKCEGYDVIVYGMDGKPEVFTDFSIHPFANGRAGKVFNSKGERSTASGRYQFLVKYWKHYKEQLGLKDFGPESQDKWCDQLIRECKAMDDIDAGRITQAIHKCRSRWASLPGAGYNQREHDIDKLLKAYKDAGGVLVS